MSMSCPWVCFLCRLHILFSFLLTAHNLPNRPEDVSDDLWCTRSSSNALLSYQPQDARVYLRLFGFTLNVICRCTIECFVPVHFQLGLHPLTPFTQVSRWLVHDDCSLDQLTSLFPNVVKVGSTTLTKMSYPSQHQHPRPGLQTTVTKLYGTVAHRRFTMLYTVILHPMPHATFYSATFPLDHGPTMLYSSPCSITLHVLSKLRLLICHPKSSKRERPDYLVTASPTPHPSMYYP
jgi:hypothetical protein